MRAYHGDPAIKAAILRQLRAHRAADQIVQGYFWQNGKGCSVGCTIHGSDHAQYEVRFGIPQTLARIQDGIFERLTPAEARDWPVAFMAAVPVGADLARVGWLFLAWVLRDLPAGAVAAPAVKAVVDRVAAIMDRLGAGETVPREEIAAARSAARAAEAAAWAEAEAEAAAAAETASRAEAPHRQGERLLTLLREAASVPELR